MIFINDLYEGQSVPSAAKHAGVVKTIAYQWLERWNESGINGPTPGFAGGKPSKLSAEQKKELMSVLETKENWDKFMGTYPREIDIVMEYSATGKYVAKLLRYNGFHIHLANPVL